MSSPQVPHSVSGQIACPHGQGHDHALTLQDTHELLSTMEIMTWHLADVWPPGRSTRGLCHKDSPDSKVDPTVRAARTAWAAIAARTSRPVHSDRPCQSMQAPVPVRAKAQDRAELGGASQSQAGQAELAAWPLGL